MRLQFTIHVATRTVLAGLVLAMLALLVMSLTLTEAVVREWTHLPSGTTPEGSTTVTIPWIGLDLYYATDALAVAAVVGAFASVVFAGSALSQDDVRARLLEPEHDRLRHLLFLAGTYRKALAEPHQHWQGRPGMRYESVRRFETDDTRRRPYFEKFGTTWPDEGGVWTAFWSPGTGELAIRQSGRGLSMLVRGNKDSRVTEILAIRDSNDEVVAALAGYDELEEDERSLEWLRERAATLRS